MDIQWIAGKPVNVRIHSALEGPCKVCLPGGASVTSVSSGESSVDFTSKGPVTIFRAAECARYVLGIE